MGTSTLLVSMLLFPPSLQAATAPLLGTAAGFAVLGASTVTNTNPTVVNGDLGVSPGTAVVGFPPGIVTGVIYSGLLSNAGAAQADALTAYSNAAGQACDTDLTGVDLGGQTLTPGVYCFDNSAQLTGTLTLDFLGDSAAIFVFQMGSTLTTASNANVVAINGSPSCHQVFWQVGSSATLGTDTDFQGDILALASVTLDTGVTSTGSVYALTGAVTMDTNSVGTCVLCANGAECTDDGNICTDDICAPTDPGADVFGCIYPDNTASCEDGLFCTEGDICGAGACLGGAALDCGDGNVCTTDSCDEEANACVHAPNTDPCDDLSFCTVNDACSAGACTGDVLDCSDENDCTTDSCDEDANACVNAPNTDPCDDLSFCTVNDACSAGACTGDVLDCGDGNDCTTDSCDEEANACVHAPNTGPCDDLSFCTVNDACSAGACTGDVLDCDDGNVCTTDSCDDEANACVHAPNTDPCSDGLFCNGVDVCSNGVCNHPGDPCLGGDVCGNTCNEAADNCLVPGGTICRAVAGQCDVAEVCTGTAAGCPGNEFESAGTPCGTDNNACTDDVCDGLGVCTHQDDTASCGNGVVDVDCGEECDRPGTEICNNGTDDDGDDIIDCVDPDCINPPVVSCSALCEFVAPCTRIANDPALIHPSSMDPRAKRMGSFSFHGRIIPTTPVDPQLEGFAVTITNENGVFYRAEVPPGALVRRRKGRFVYRAMADEERVLEPGGIDRLYVRRRKDGGELGYGLRVRAFGDLSGATVPLMTTQVYLGDDVAYLTASWKLVKERWRLLQKDY